MVNATINQDGATGVPLDWEISKVGRIAQVSSGGTPSRKNAAYWNGEIPWITTALINGGEIDTAEEFITDLGLSNSAAKIFSANTLLMAMYGQGKTRGKVGILKVDAAINQACAAIVVNKGILPEFLLHQLNHKYQEIRELSNSGGQENLSGDIVRRIPILVPDAAEQNLIAEALADVDAFIENLEALITKKHDIKTATMQQLLTGKTRTTGFSNENGFQETEVGRIPSEWHLSTYGDVFKFLPTATNSRSDLIDDADFGYIHYGDIHVKFQESLDLGSAHLPEIAADGSKCRAFVRKGDLVMADASEDYDGIGKSVEIAEVPPKPVIAGLHTFLLRDKDQTFVDGYRGYLHLMNGVIGQFRRLATGLKVYGLSKGSLAQVVVPIPSKTEQRQIVEILSAMRDEISHLEHQLEKMTAIKRGMMQELLTGRTRLI